MLKHKVFVAQLLIAKNKMTGNIFEHMMHGDVMIIKQFPCIRFSFCLSCQNIADHRYTYWHPLQKFNIQLANGFVIILVPSPGNIVCRCNTFVCRNGRRAMCVQSILV